MDAKKIIELKQERATLTTSIRALMSQYENVEMPGDKGDELNKMEARADAITSIVDREEKQLNRERIIGEKEENRRESPKHDEVHNAFVNYLRDGTAMTMQQYHALAQDNPTQAGYLVAPEQFVMELIREIADLNFMRTKARVLPPLSGAQSLGYPTRTAGMSSFAWGTELAAPTPDTTLAFGKREFKPRPGTSEILLSKTLVRNVANADTMIRGEIAEDANSGLEEAYMNGLGVNCPLGIFTASDDGIPASRDVSTGNTATEIKFDNLIEVQEMIKPQYQGNCQWIFHRDAIKQLRKLKNSDGQYIWQPSVVMGQPDMLLSKPINRSEKAPHTFTTGKYVGAYGDLKTYWICDSLAMEIQVLTELYARTNQIDYITRLETDGAPVMPSAWARVKLG
jgi:HK97 family phage major capsid protein